MTYYHRPNLGSDPETNIIDANNNQIVPASVVLDEYFDIKEIKPEALFTIQDGGQSISLRRTTRETKVGPVHYLKAEKTFGGVTPNIVVDGTAMEINTVPASCRRYVVISVATGLNIIGKILDTVNRNGHNYKLTVDPTVELSEDTLKGLPKQAAVFGCDADTDVYGKVTSASAIDASNHPKRYAGAHIHMSFGYPGEANFMIPAYTNDVFENKETRLNWFAENMFTLTKLYDRTMGLAATAISTSAKESERREVYGQAGRVRIQPYGGIEYRTPSSYILLDPTIFSYILLWAQVANNIIFNDPLHNEIENLYPIEKVVAAINNGDSKTAMEMIEATHNLVKQFENLSVLGDHKKQNKLEFVKYIYERGGSHVVFDPDKTAERWGACGLAPGYAMLPEIDGYVAALKAEGSIN